MDALGNPLKLCLSSGNVHDCSVAIEVLSGITLSVSVVLADKAYGTSNICIFIEECGGTYCISPKTNAKEAWDCDYEHYKERHVVECFFGKLK